MYLCCGCAGHAGPYVLAKLANVNVCCLSMCLACVMYSLQEPCSPGSDKHDAGLRKQSAPVVQHVLQSNNSVVVQPHTDDRKTDKGWAQFEEDCQGVWNICHHHYYYYYYY